MSQAILSLEQSPPLSAPGPYFAVAPLFALAAGLLLFFQPALLQSRWLPGTLALTHLISLGFMALVMTGAFQQLLPVLAGAPVFRPVAVAWTLFAALAGGTVALAFGLATGARFPLALAVVSLGGGFALFLAVATWALMRSPSRHPAIRTMGMALGALALTAALGVMLAAGHAGWGPVERHFTFYHLLWGALGWIAMLVMGVAYQVVPMFQVTPDYPRALVRLLAPGLLVSLLLLSALTYGGRPEAHWAGAPAAFAVAWFAVATLGLQRARRRRLADATVSFWRLAMISLLAAVVVWFGATVTGRQLPALPLGTLFFVGFGMSAVNGMLYKIVPFLVWLHLNNLNFLAGGARVAVPTMKQVIPEAPTRLHFYCHLLAVGVLTLAAAYPGALLVRTAALLFSASAALLGFNLWSALALYYRRRRACLAPPAAVGA